MTTYEKQLEIIMKIIDDNSNYQSKIVVFREEMTPQLREELITEGYFIDFIKTDRGKAYNLIKNYTPIEEYLLNRGWRRLEVIFNGRIYWCKVREIGRDYNWFNQVVSFFYSDDEGKLILDTMNIWGNGNEYSFNGEHYERERQRLSSLTMILEKEKEGYSLSTFDDLNDLLLFDEILKIGKYSNSHTILFTQLQNK